MKAISYNSVMNYYSYEMCRQDVKLLIEQSRSFEPDAIVAIARGGLMLGELMGYGMGVRNVQSLRVESYDGKVQRQHVKIFDNVDLSACRRVLIVDDIIDSAKTMQAVTQHLHARYPSCTFKVAALFYKPTALMQPDYKVQEAVGWIDFFWEVDFV